MDRWSRSIFLAVVLSLLAVPSFAGEDVTPGCRLPAHMRTTLPPEQVGAWKTVFPAEGSAAIRQADGLLAAQSGAHRAGRRD
jgi:hypothetical protein